MQMVASASPLGAEMITRATLPPRWPAAFSRAVNTPVDSITRRDGDVEILAAGAGGESFDHVIIAPHSDQALRMLRDPSERDAGAAKNSPRDAARHTLCEKALRVPAEGDHQDHAEAPG